MTRGRPVSRSAAARADAAPRTRTGGSELPGPPRDGVAVVLPPELVRALADAVLPMLRAEQQHEQQVEPFIGVDDAAAHLACGKSRVYRLVHMRKMPFHKDGARLLFRRSELDNWVEKGGAK